MNTLKIWETLSNKPGGKWAFSQAICFKAPYFKSIDPTFIAVRPEYCQISMPKTRRVLNHLNTVHAIAMCNMAELAGGTMTEVTVPQSHRWIPNGMTVKYLKKATTDLIATATPFSSINLDQPSEYVVQVDVTNTANELVFQAHISMWVSVKK